MKIFSVLLILGLATALRCWNLGGASIWADEQDSLMQSRILSEIWPNRGNGALYYTLLNFWRAGLGDSAIALRSLSVLLGLLTVPAIGWLTFRISRDRFSAFLAAGLAAVMPILVWHSRDARMYPLWTLAVLLGLHALLEYRDKGATIKVVCDYGAAQFIAFFSHSFHVFYAVGFAVAIFFIALDRETTPRAARKNWLKLHVPVFLAFGFGALRFWWLDPNPLQYLKRHSVTLMDFRFLPSLAEVGLYRNPALSQFGDAWAGLCIFVILLICTSAIKNDRAIPLGTRRALLAVFWIPLLIMHLLPIRDYARLFIPSAALSLILMSTALNTQYQTLGRRIQFPALGLIVMGILGAIFFEPLRIGLSSDMEPWKRVCKILQFIPSDRWVVTETEHPQSPIQQCGALNRKVYSVSPHHDSASRVAAAIGRNAKVVVFRSPRWLGDEHSVLQFYPHDQFEVRTFEWGPYLLSSTVQPK